VDKQNCKSRKVFYNEYMADQKKILVVDDEQDMLDLYGAVLKSADFDVTTALNGPEGIKQAKALHPDLVLLDFKMPDMDGIEVLGKLKEDPATKDVRIVFFSAFGDRSVNLIDEQAAKEIGALAFIQKGIGNDELVQKIKQILAS